MNPLQLRLFALRRRLQLVVSFRGICWLIALAVGCAALFGAIDWMSPLPSVIRAFLLVGTLGGAAYVGYRYLYIPLCTKNDDLSLALRIEAQFPELNDALASTVQFLEPPTGSDPGDSPSLRRQAVEHAMRQAQSCDFNKAIDTRGLRRATLSFVVGAGLTAYLLLWHPALAATALVRLGDPFGEHDWPRQTRLEVTYRARVPAGQPFEILGELKGEIPNKAVVEFEGMSVLNQEFPVLADRKGQTGVFIARLDMTRQQGSFRFRVRANDAVSPKKAGLWHHVAVVQPPELVSFRMRLEHPPYTDLPPEEVQSSYDSLQLVLGTRVIMEGATDRRVTRVWMEPELAGLLGAGGSLSAQSPWHSLALDAARRALENAVPATLLPDGKTFRVQMVPPVSGIYSLRWEDEQGVGLRRSFLIEVRNDPAPEVGIECASLGGKTSAVTPDASLTLRVTAKDEEYAVRSVYLEFRRKDEAGNDLDQDWQRIPLYDYRAAGKNAPRLALAGLAGFPPSLALEKLRLRVKNVELTRRWSLEGLVKEGNILVIRAGADDFDEVSPGKAPGLSSPLEIVIVKPEALKPLIEEAVREVRDELLRLNETQKNSVGMVRQAEQQMRNTGRLRPEDLKQLMDARIEQKKIEERIGKDKSEGLQKDVERIRRMLEDNRLPPSPLREKMADLAKTLDRLTKDQLGKVQDQLEEARKAAEEAADKLQNEKSKELTQARRTQEEVQKTLEALLDDLDPYVNIQEMQGQARNLKDEQGRVLKETGRIQREVVRKNPETKQLESDLKVAADRQERLAEQAKKLLEKMREAAQKRRENAPNKKDDVAELLEKAARTGRDKGVDTHMADAAKSLQEGKTLQDKKFFDAMDAQAKSMKTLDEVIAAMEEKPEQELDRLSKKQQEEQDRLDDLKKEMDELRKKTRDIQKNIKDSEQRRRELKKLAGKQRELQEKVDQMLRRLSRLRAQEAVQEMRRLSRRMEEAARRMEDGEDPEQKQQEALDRINDAVEKLQKANDRVENKLAREKLAKKADEIKRLKAQQDEAIEEEARIHKEMRAKASWDRILLSSYGQLMSNRQQALALETGKLAEDLKQARVFSYILVKTKRAMDNAVKQMKTRLSTVVMERNGRKLTKEELDDEDRADRQVRKYQEEAGRRLQRLLDALKQGGGGAPPPAGANKQEPQPGQEQDGPSPPSQDGIPSLAEQKALRAEQQEINERTQDFNKRHPEPDKLTDTDKKELEDISQEQAEARKLAMSLFMSPEKEKKGGAQP